jgi:peptidyl-prolyl cis-trans isomerase B (cyclophilin B)
VSRPVIATLVVALALAAAGCGGGDNGGTSSGGGQPSSASTPGEAAATAGSLPAGCRRVPQPRPRAETNVPRPTRRLERTSAAVVTMRTNCGAFGIRLAVRRAPKTASSFASLVSRGFYDGLTFHRIAGSGAQAFVIQGGDPLGTGLGGPGYSVVERPPTETRYTRYTVAMAKGATEPPGASGSQFFVVTANDAGLPPEYALVGTVDKGTDVVDRIASVPTTADERPVAPVVIEKATLRAS